MLQVLKRIDNLLDHVTSSVSGALMTALTVLTLVGVFFRYVLGNPLSWVYELTIVCFSWMIFLGTAMAFKKNEHIALVFVVAKLPPRLQYVWRQVIFAICIIFFVVAFVFGLRVVQGTWGQLYNTIPVSRGLFYLSLPVAAVPAVIHILVQMLELKVGDQDVEHDIRFDEDAVIHEDDK